MRNEFAIFEICNTLGYERERFRSWVKDGFVKPTYPAKGKSIRAVFTRADVYRVALFADLITNGFHRSMASTFVHKFLRLERHENIRFVGFLCKWHEEIDQIGKLTTRETTVLQSPDDSIFETVKKDTDWDHLHIIDFAKIRRNVDQALEIFG